MYKRQEQKLIEYAQYVNHYYGTPKEYVEQKMAEGKDVILSLIHISVWQIGLSIALYDHMGTGNAFGMEPPVIAACYFKSKLFILIVIFSYKNVIAVRR